MSVEIFQVIRDDEFHTLFISCRFYRITIVKVTSLVQVDKHVSLVHNVSNSAMIIL